MKVKFKKVISVLSLMCIFFACFSESQFIVAKTSNKEIHKLYEKKVKQVKKREKKNLYYYGDFYFRYYDINKDGIDECIITHCDTYDLKNDNKITGFMKATDIAIYTYKKGKVKKMVSCFPGGGTWGNIGISKNSKYITFYNRNGWEYDSYSFKKIKNGNLKETVTCVHDENKTNKYTVNGKKVTKSKFNKTVSKYGGTKGITLYKITNKNLKKQR